jgi:hypothetical protein
MTMPSFRDLLSALALAMTMVMGRVTNLTVSNTVQSGQNLTAVLEITSYSQNWDDFGVRPGPRPTSILPPPSSLTSLWTHDHRSTSYFLHPREWFKMMRRMEILIDRSFGD